ncbi:hypothetical protein [Natronorubrum halalkaliphilum]|uniref:hypothetical protein n=1 Tax=Natronorubrum halalkaliphilum TaxID=2691917 RepID=UPI001916474F|nr:hypothetical protein [Natronorubrum halalkaliphilum]
MSLQDTMDKYEVVDESCTCPDWQQRTPEVTVSICDKLITKSNVDVFFDQIVISPLGRGGSRTNPLD